jgi:hypothetical protein
MPGMQAHASYQHHGVRQEEDCSIEQFRTIVMLCSNCHRCYDDHILRFEQGGKQFDMDDMLTRYNFVKNQIGNTLLEAFEKAKGVTNQGYFVATYNSILKKYATDIEKVYRQLPALATITQNVSDNQFIALQIISMKNNVAIECAAADCKGGKFCCPTLEIKLHWR